MPAAAARAGGPRSPSHLIPNPRPDPDLTWVPRRLAVACCAADQTSRATSYTPIRFTIFSRSRLMYSCSYRIKSKHICLWSFAAETAWNMEERCDQPTIRWIAHSASANLNITKQLGWRALELSRRQAPFKQQDRYKKLLASHWGGNWWRVCPAEQPKISGGGVWRQWDSRIRNQPASTRDPCRGMYSCTPDARSSTLLFAWLTLIRGSSQ